MSLDRFREVTLDESRTAAEQELRDARAAADAKLASCDAEAERLVSQSLVDGREAASREMVAQERLARRRARETVLAARRALYEQVQREGVEGLRALRGREEYRRLIGALEARASEQLGAEVRCHEEIGDQGGVVAEADGRRVTYSLAALVDDELRRRGAQLEQLWT